MSRRADAATLLERALVGDASRCAVAADVTAATSVRWASATFVGARHQLTIGGERSAASDAWLDRLTEAELPVRGHLVADLAVSQRSHCDGRFRALIEVLTLEDA